MARQLSFEEWTGGATEAELRELEKITRKRFNIFILISLIPFVNFITMGCAIFCYNTLSYIKSRGRNNGSDIIRFIFMLYALFIPPIIVVQACARIKPLGNAVLGWK